MEEKKLKGTVSFVNYEKNFATIEYGESAKKKSVNCRTDALVNGKKPHHFRVGDSISFELKLSDRGDKMTAYNVKFLHNTALALLIQKAVLENRFSGYLKKVEEKFFVKELNSYFFFPLQLSPWEKPPVETAENEIISFTLLNPDRINNIVAGLFSHNYIPQYKKAIQHFNNKIPVEALVYKISLHAVYLNLFDDSIQARLQLTSEEKEKIKEGDKIQVLITHLTSSRIVVTKVITN